MAIAEGEQISAAEISALNAAYAFYKVNASVSVTSNVFEFDRKTKETPYSGTFYIRNDRADNASYSLTTNSSGSARASKASLEIKNYLGTTILNIDEDGADRTVSGNLTLPSGRYTYSGRVYVMVKDLGLRTSSASCSLLLKPSDDLVSENDTIAIFKSDFSANEESLLSATKALQGLFTKVDYPGQDRE